MFCPVCKYAFAYPDTGQPLTSGEALSLLDHAKLCGLVVITAVCEGDGRKRQSLEDGCRWKCICGFYDRSYTVTGKHLATHHDWEKFLVRKALEEYT